MKNLITIIIMLVAAGCGKSEVETKTETETGKTEKKPLSPEEKLVGSYEAKKYDMTVKLVLLENGKGEVYAEGNRWKATWKIVGKEVHFLEGETTGVLKIKPNGDLTEIAYFFRGERKDISKDFQSLWRKVK